MGESGRGWVTSIQQATHNRATCRDFGYPFQGDAVRMSTLVNARGNKSCYSDVECIPGGLHPLDALEHLSRLSHEQLADVETVRLSKDKLGPAMPFARLRKTVTEATAVYGPAWWATRTWADMGTSDRGHPLSPRGAHKDGPRESARYAYRGTIVVEASHPGPAARSIDPRCGTAPACRRSGLTESCEDGPRFPGGGNMPEASPMGESGRGHRCSWWSA